MVRLGKKAIPNYMLPITMHFKYNNKNRFKLEGWTNIYHDNTNPERQSIFQIKQLSVIKKHFIITKGSIHQTDLTVLHVSASKTRASKCRILKLIELQGE